MTRATTRAEQAASTMGRLLDATAGILRTEGAAAVSVQRVADAAGVSKGLVHYHFDGKEALLRACADRLSAQLVEAETAALARSVPASALDDLWLSIADPANRGMRRALLALTIDTSASARTTLAEVAARRRAAASLTLARLESLFGFTPTVPRATLALAYLALVDGLTLDESGASEVEPRRAFEVFWLAVLTLGA